MNPVDLITKTFQFKIGNTTFQPAYWHAISIVFLLFLLIITMAQVRRHFMDYSLRGGVVGVLLGFALALVIEGFMILGGHTILTNVLGWKNAPKPISNALDAGKSKLVDVLGTQTSPQPKEKLSQDQIIESYQSLNPDIQRTIRSTICSP
ncbi:hypothetical protein HYS03_02575 [Candidatus Woesebacteria bacterium]|nr:hypothetical protein [Candidatus Woesebacteria bacterium]QQG47918.1 MAG: hypothetical protein HY044_02425 [Candidatus Woesebacteria bacterium]